MKNSIPITATKDNEVRHFKTLSECASALGVTVANISTCLKKQWKVKGHILTKA